MHVTVSERSHKLIPILSAIFLMTGLLVAPALAATVAGGDIVLDRAESLDEWLKSADQRPALSTGFVGVRNKRGVGKRPVAADDTQLRAVLLPKGLGFLIRCGESSIDKIAAATKASLRDKRSLTRDDDYVEVSIDINRDAETAFAIAVNPKGAVVDVLYYAQDYLDVSWNSSVKPRVKIGKDFWSVAFEVSFASMGVKPTAGDVIALGCYRVRRAGIDKNIPFWQRTGGFSAWPRGGLFWTWWQRRQLLDPTYFAPVLLGGETGPLKLRSATRGRLSARAEELNVFAGLVTNESKQAREFRFEAVTGKKGLKRLHFRKGKLSPGKSLPISFTYDATSAGGVVFRLFDAKTNKCVYESRASRTFTLPNRQHDLRGDYDARLVEKTAPAPIKHFTVPHNLSENRETMNAMRWGRAYNQKAVMAQLGRDGAGIFSSYRLSAKYNDLTTHAPLMRRYGAKSMFYGDYKDVASRRPGGLAASNYLVNISKGPKPPTPWQVIALPCDQMMADYTSQIDRAFKEHPDLIYAVFVADELDSHLKKAMKIAFSTPEYRKRYPMVMEIDKDIRKRFGFGRYGLIGPDTPKADLIFCKIAIQRWVNEWAARFNDHVASHVHKHNPKVLVISDDPEGQVFPNDIGRRWRNVDILNHQTHEKAMPNDIATGVISKVVTDLTGGKKEYWPFIHVEGTSQLHSLAEMREIMSRGFRNGATGIATYNLNWGGRLSQAEDFAAPLRWRYFNQIAKFYAAGHRAKLPQNPKLAVLYSSYSAMATYSKGTGAAYRVFGPDSGAYFRFVDDLAIERGDVDLKQYSTLIVYAAEYESPTVARALIDAVRKDGLTLVITDTDAFKTSIESGELKERAELLGGISFGKEFRRPRVGPADGADARLRGIQPIRPHVGKVIVPPKGSTVLLKYKTGEPACVSTPMGRGRVIWFGFQPLQLSKATLGPNEPTGFDYGDKPIVDPMLASAGPAGAFFKGFFKYLDIPTDEKIWSLKLPAPEQTSDWPEGFCLTGNSILWRLSRPRMDHNVGMIGRYRYSTPPEQDAACDDAGWIDFTKGRLTDRIRALLDLQTADDSVASWKQTKALSVEIDLGFSAEVRHVDLYLSGFAPGCGLSVSDDGSSWKKVSRNDKPGDVRGVAQVRLGADGKQARFLRVDFDSRPAGKEMTVVELDVWGDVAN